MGLHKNKKMSFRTPLFNRSVKINILRDLEGEILWGLFLLEKVEETLENSWIITNKILVLLHQN